MTLLSDHNVIFFLIYKNNQTSFSKITCLSALETTTLQVYSKKKTNKMLKKPLRN